MAGISQVTAAITQQLFFPANVVFGLCQPYYGGYYIIIISVPPLIKVVILAEGC
jgi:hypothetical protein